MVNRKEIKNKVVHFSTTKSQFLRITDMHPVYAVNVLVQRVKDLGARDVLDDMEFQSLILNLADTVKERIKAKQSS